MCDNKTCFHILIRLIRLYCHHHYVSKNLSYILSNQESFRTKFQAVTYNKPLTFRLPIPKDASLDNTINIIMGSHVFRTLEGIRLLSNSSTCKLSIIQLHGGQWWPYTYTLITM